MFRPTPVRVLYLVVGLVIGAIALYGYISVAGAPAFLTSILPMTAPRSGAQPGAEAPAAFTGRILDKILPVNQEATKGGVQVRINTLEEYSDGFTLTYSIVGGEPGEPAPVLQPERFVVADDRGASYQVSPLGSAATVGPGLSDGYLAFSPALSTQASALTVTVPHVLVLSNTPESGAPQVVDGPWQVQVPLR